MIRPVFRLSDRSCGCLDVDPAGCTTSDGDVAKQPKQKGSRVGRRKRGEPKATDASGSADAANSKKMPRKASKTAHKQAVASKQASLGRTERPLQKKP